MFLGPVTAFGNTKEDEAFRALAMVVAQARFNGLNDHLRQEKDAERFLRIPLQGIEVTDQQLNLFYRAGWAFVLRRQGMLTLADRYPNDTLRSFQLFWSLELEDFKRPGEVDFHTMTCTLAPTETDSVNLLVRAALFEPIRAEGRRWGSIFIDHMDDRAGVRVWRYRINSTSR